MAKVMPVMITEIKIMEKAKKIHITLSILFEENISNSFFFLPSIHVSFHAMPMPILLPPRPSSLPSIFPER